MEPQTILGTGKVTPLGIRPSDKNHARKQKEELTGVPYYNMVNVRFRFIVLSCMFIDLIIFVLSFPFEVGSLEIVRSQRRKGESVAAHLNGWERSSSLMDLLLFSIIIGDCRALAS